jgi:translation initiation factor 1
MSLDNFKTFDPFADTGGDDDQPQNLIHIRIQQRNGRKTLTTVQGLPKDYDPKRILKTLKKEFATNGNVVQDENLGEVIQFQGDQRQKISGFIIDTLGIEKKNVKIHGF